MNVPRHGAVLPSLQGQVIIGHGTQERHILDQATECPKVTHILIEYSATECPKVTHILSTVPSRGCEKV